MLENMILSYSYIRNLGQCYWQLLRPLRFWEMTQVLAKPHVGRQSAVELKLALEPECEEELPVEARKDTQTPGTYSRLQKVGMWPGTIHGGSPSSLGFGVGGQSCSNFLASTRCTKHGL